jgi:hypothetical protein
MKKVEKIFDASTGEETIVERDETPEEKLEREELEILHAKIQQEIELREKQRQKLLDRLGITVEELKIILS